MILLDKVRIPCAGLTGFRDLHQQNAGFAVRVAVAMVGRLVHCGPDGRGVRVGEGPALAHRRLAIRDPSEVGHQPVVSTCGRYVIAFNGGIYNHPDLRAELKAAGGCARLVGPFGYRDASGGYRSTWRQSA